MTGARSEEAIIVLLGASISEGSSSFASVSTVLEAKASGADERLSRFAGLFMGNCCVSAFSV